MIFAPQTSVVRNVCGRVPSWIRIIPITPPTWSLELQKLEGHTSSVSAVAFSQDGSLLASASYDETVRLWNPATGQEVQKPENIGYIGTLNFTDDDKNLLTNQGTISIKKKFISIPTPKSSSHQTLMIKNSWIQRDNRNFLWLPQEYRDTCSTFHNNTFAFGLHSGQVSILNVDFSF